MKISRKVVKESRYEGARAESKLRMKSRRKGGAGKEKVAEQGKSRRRHRRCMLRINSRS